MEKVLNQAELLAEAILESEEYIKMRLAEQAAMNDEGASKLITEYSERRSAVESLLASNDVDHDKLAAAGAELEATQKQIDEYPLLCTMREANEAFTHMMQQVNRIIKLVVTGEDEQESGCTGSCDSCGGSCHHH